MINMETKQKFVNELLRKGIIIEKDAMNYITTKKIDFKEIYSRIELNKTILTKKYLEEQIKKLEKVEIKKTKRIVAKDYESKIEIIKNFTENKTEKNITSFINYYNYRYEKVKNLLISRPELNNAVSLCRLTNNSTRQEVSVIGMVSNVFTTKANNKIIELEDPTGKINVFIRQNKNINEDFVILDDIIGVVGNISNNYLDPEKIIWPEIPLPTKIKTLSDPVNAAFISDLHFGSKEFLNKISEKFINLINNGEKTNGNIKYLFIAGDLVDGVGVYPDQENDLTIKDIYKQYNAFEEFIEKIPEHIEIIICPGNHDAVRQAEPQLPVNKEYLPNIYNLKNIHLVSNPAQIKICGDGEESVSVLMYHGSSFNRLISALPYLRTKNAMTNAEHVMKDVLRRRHLAPTYGSTLISPEDHDFLYIDQVPDIFHTGDLHSFSIDNYKGTTLINSSTFQAQTSFMDKIGHTANPGKITIVNLQNREVTIKDLMKAI